VRTVTRAALVCALAFVAALCAQAIGGTPWQGAAAALFVCGSTEIRFVLELSAISDRLHRLESEQTVVGRRRADRPLRDAGSCHR
jgi:hypothetical protein